MSRSGVSLGETNWRRLAVIGALGLTALPLVAGILYTVSSWPNLPPKDWTALREVGLRCMSGDWSHLYDDQHIPGLGTMLFLYPPFVAWLLVPLALVPPAWAWVGVATLQVACVMVSVALLRRMVAIPHVDLVTLAIVVAAPFTHVIVTGQNSGVLCLIMVLGAFHLMRGKPVLGGATLGLLAMKPNWLPGFLLLAAWQGGPRAGVSLLGAAAALAASSAPFGFGAWSDYGKMMRRSRDIMSDIPGCKKIALRAALESAGLTGAQLEGAWLACAVGLGVALLVLFVCQRSVPRRLGGAVLFTISANLYMNFYDALVLFIPAVVWWATRAQWSTLGWRLAGACIVFIFVWDHAVFYLPFPDGWTRVGSGWPPGSVLGVPIAIWLVIDAVDGLVLWRAGRPAPPPTPGEAGTPTKPSDVVQSIPHPQ